MKFSNSFLISESLPFKLVDLTHTLDPEIPSWNGECGFHYDIKCDYSETQGDVKFRVHQIKMHAGIGTHMDAPAHCIPQGATLSDFPLDYFASPLVVIDVSSKAKEDYQVTCDDVISFEKEFAPIPPTTFVIFYTGWEHFWNEPPRYRNNLRFPSLSKEVALFLLERRISGLGIDTLSPDCPQNGFPVHELILGYGKYIVENVAHAKKMPPVGGYSLAFPLKIHGGTEAPMRFAGLILKDIS